jgi:hypothetical protein
VTWRVGTKLGRTLYRDEVFVGVVDTPEIAAEIVAAMNGACVECALDVPLSKADTLSIWAELQLRADSPCVRTEAEQRVLDAMAAWPEADLRDPLDAPPASQRQHAWRCLIELCRAELARRGLKP